MVAMHAAAQLALDKVSTGATVRLAGLTIDGPDRLRMAQHGIRPGAELTVLHRTAGGGRVIAVATNRIAIDRSTAHRITVEAV